MNQNNPSDSPKREVVGVFADRRGFEDAIRKLLAAGYDRRDLSVLASHESLDAAGKPAETWKDAITATIGEMKYEVPLVASGAIFLAGGPVAAVIAGLVGATVGGLAVKEALDAVTAKPPTDDFARALDAGSVILWVQIPHGEKESISATILEEC
ncbi:MAG: hypothetical protein RBS99_13735, partial [Rhodospirillales bacterium]|nr:hypothetical protein [Rhodospirillales bacterium]